ncbi:MAG TPA: LytTR family DNA-binding domain-containing protein [Eudoraea sp.]|nr:LytTR family DNA-binding domain-containing protein [Eudoraea sp.]
MKISRFLYLFVFIGILLGLLIYWRESTVRDQVSLYQVLLWQIGIWTPWIIGVKVFEKLARKTCLTKFRLVWLAGLGAVWVGIHFGWFFLLSSNYSPYLDLPETRYGVYPYFFIFWTLMDIGLMWFIIDKFWVVDKEEVPLLFELTRGGNKYFCQPEQIYWLAAENYYTRLFTTEGIFVMRKPLKSFYGVLPSEMFKKIHRSTIINVNYVAELARGNDHSLEVILKDGTRRRVSRNFVKEINLFFKNRTN